MAFIRVKKIKGNEYAYLVESQWDPGKGGTRQRILEYLGPVRDLSLEDVPEEYRDEDARAFVLRHSVREAHRRARLIEGWKERLLAAVLEGDVGAGRDVAGEAVQAVGLDQLYVHVVTPVMHEVGARWARREIPVSQEHLATNTMAQILAERNAAIKWTGPTRDVAMVCVPDGERHRLAAPVLTGLLRNRGYRVLDVSASAPTSSVVAYARQRRPALVLVSVTMGEQLYMARNLIEGVRDAVPEARILVGGQAVLGAGVDDLPPDVPRCGPDTLGFLDGLAEVRTE